MDDLPKMSGYDHKEGNFCQASVAGITKKVIPGRCLWLWSQEREFFCSGWHHKEGDSYQGSLGMTCDKDGNFCQRSLVSITRDLWLGQKEGNSCQGFLVRLTSKEFVCQESLVGIKNMITLPGI
jgi:hypothetical protein